MTAQNDNQDHLIDQHFDYQNAELRIYANWEEGGHFKPYDNDEAENYAIVIPPPNVTGSLHMGHALNNTLQDILVRYNRMKGKNVLWQVGTDHAGIATQMVVERQMAERQEPRRVELGREKFLEKVWAWKEQSGGTITGQLRRLGASVDWSRERFTMDDGLSKAVKTVFLQLYKDGLIYREKKLVNWDPKFETAISDLEVESKDVKGQMWFFKYPLADGATYDHPIFEDEEGNTINGVFDEDGMLQMDKATRVEKRDYIMVGTTRPETMLGDTGVAVHPKDPRYTDLIGKHVDLPIVGRKIEIVTDMYAAMDKGTGAVKITPAHDFNDFMVGKRAGLDVINILTKQAAIIDDADWIPAELRGLDRFDARAKIVEKIDALGLLDHIEENKMAQPYGDRSGVVIEPYLTDQWFIDAEKMAVPARAAVESGKTKFVPANWDKTFYNWMDNIEPWCISRQLWWGHQIPIWYGPDGLIIAAEDDADALAQANVKGGTWKIVDRETAIENDFHTDDTQLLYRDEDVLDTWFSSALWPFSTMGWTGEGADETLELQKFYPTSVLSTAFDIIFFWVARMMMMGIYFMDEVPFSDVYIHALVLDEHGQKMSKSKGNVIDPLEFCDKYGTDALRFTLASQAATGRDLRMSEDRVSGYAKFVNKLWNVARYTQMNGCTHDATFDPSTVELTLNKWILAEGAKTTNQVEAAINAYKFNDAADIAYQFVWNTFAAWYVEFTKPIFFGENEVHIAETRQSTSYAVDMILKMLHPIMPYVTEELWGTLKEKDNLLINENWGSAIDAGAYADAAEELNWLTGLITEIRSARAEMNVPGGAKIDLVVIGDLSDKLTTHTDLLQRMARIENVSASSDVPKGSVQVPFQGVTYALPIADVIDIGAEMARLNKNMGKVTGELKGLEGRLKSPAFVEKAPEKVVNEAKQQAAELNEKKAQLEEAIKRLRAL